MGDGKQAPAGVDGKNPAGPSQGIYEIVHGLKALSKLSKPTHLPLSLQQSAGSLVKFANYHFASRLTRTVPESLVGAFYPDLVSYQNGQWIFSADTRDVDRGEVHRFRFVHWHDADK